MQAHVVILESTAVPDRPRKTMPTPRVPRRFAIPQQSWRLPGGLTLEVYQPDGADRLHAHTHPGHCINIVLDGTLLETRAEATFELRTGSISLLPAEMPHAIGIRGRCARVVHLEFGAEFLMRLPQRWQVIRDVPPLLDDATRVLSERFRVELRQADSLSPLAFEVLASEALLQLLRAGEQAPVQIPERLRELQEHLAANPTQPSQIGALAQTIGVSTRALSQLFRRHYGQTLADHLIGLRMRAACSALIDSDRPLGLIADELGFADHSHFSRMFKRHMGETPGHYRQRRKGATL